MAKQKKHGKYIVKEYTAIEFIDEDSEDRIFECIPNSWLTDDSKKMCYWPPKCGTKTVMQRAINCDRPDDTWGIYPCKVISGGYMTYAAGFKIVRDKCSQKYNTSSADDQVSASNFRRKHPVLALQGEKGFEQIFSKPSTGEKYVQNMELNGTRCEQVNKKSKESAVKNINAIADVEQNLPNVGSKISSERVNDSILPSVRVRTDKVISTTKSAFGPTAKDKYHRQNREPEKRLSPMKFTSEDVNVLSVASRRSDRPSRSRSRGSRLRSRGSRSRSRGSRSRSRGSRSLSRGSSSRSRGSRSLSRGSSSRSRCSRTRSGSSSSRPGRSLSRSGSSRSRSGSPRSRSGSLSSRSSSSRRKLPCSRFNSTPEERTSKASSHRIASNESRQEKQHKKLSGRSDPNNLNLNVKRNNQTSVPQSSAVENHSNRDAASRSRSNSSSRHSTSPRPRSGRSRSQFCDSPPNSSLRSVTNRETEANCLKSKVNRMLELMEKYNRRQIEHDRRLNRIEVTINKTLILMGDLTNAKNMQVQHNGVEMSMARQIDIDSEEENDEFDAPKLPIMRVNELVTLQKDLKNRRFQQFLITKERDFCTPSKVGTHSGTMTKYLKRFVSVDVRCKLTLKEKSKSDYTLMGNFHRVYLFLIDVLRAGYRMCGKFITADEAHTAIRTVWGRSKQMKNGIDLKKAKSKRLHEKKKESERRRRR